MAKWTQDDVSSDGGLYLLRELGQKPLDAVDFSCNALTDRGADALIDFLIEHRWPVKRLKLFVNRLRTLDHVCRLLEDPVIGLGSPSGAGPEELHLSHNALDESAIEQLLEVASTWKARNGGRPIRPSLWVRVEHNGLGDLTPLLDQAERGGLKVLLSAQPNKERAAGCDVQVYNGSLPGEPVPRAKDRRDLERPRRQRSRSR